MRVGLIAIALALVVGLFSAVNDRNQRIASLEKEVATFKTAMPLWELANLRAAEKYVYYKRGSSETPDSPDYLFQIEGDNNFSLFPAHRIGTFMWEKDVRPGDTVVFEADWPSDLA